MKFDDKLFIAKKVRYYRKKMKLTQAELAEKVNLSVQHMSKIESGLYLPSLTTFFMLANVLKMDLVDFGYNLPISKNPLKNKLIEFISSASDTELIFYNNIIEGVNKSLKESRNLYR